MNAILKHVVFVLLLTTAVAALADWVVVSTSGQGSMYADPSTIQRKGKTRTVWALMDLKEPTPQGNRSVRLFQEYNCEESMVRGLQSHPFQKNMGQGATEGGSYEQTPWMHIAPDTMYNHMQTLVCRK
jgi:hypothetical protein